MGLSPPSAKKNLGPIPTSIFEWDLFHLEAVGLIPWDLVDFTASFHRTILCAKMPRRIFNSRQAVLELLRVLLLLLLLQ